MLYNPHTPLISLVIFAKTKTNKKTLLLPVGKLPRDFRFAVTFLILCIPWSKVSQPGQDGHSDWTSVCGGGRSCVLHTAGRHPRPGPTRVKNGSKLYQMAPRREEAKLGGSKQFTICINKYDFNSHVRFQCGLNDFLKKSFIRPYKTGICLRKHNNHYRWPKSKIMGFFPPQRLWVRLFKAINKDNV